MEWISRKRGGLSVVGILALGLWAGLAQAEPAGAPVEAQSSSYVQTASVIGQWKIIEVGASAHYSQGPALNPPVTVVDQRAAARLWALYE